MQKILEPVLFHNLSAQNPAAGRVSGSARESEFLLPRKHAPLPKNVNTDSEICDDDNSGVLVCIPQQGTSMTLTQTVKSVPAGSQNPTRPDLLLLTIFDAADGKVPDTCQQR
jgi:hypothetical protein